MYTTLCTTLVYHPVYPPIHPGYTTMVSCLALLYATVTGSVLLRDNEALGSTLGIVRDQRRREALQLPKV